MGISAMADADDMRMAAFWMKPPDDRLLEKLRDVGNLTPKAISKEGDIPRVGITRKYAGQRLRDLWRHGMLVRVDEGLYRISEDGLGYLDETVDAAELEQRETGPMADE